MTTVKTEAKGKDKCSYFSTFKRISYLHFIQVPLFSLFTGIYKVYSQP